MLIYTMRRLNLFLITLLIISLICYRILCLDPLSPWSINDFFPGWLEYIQDMLHLDFGLDIHQDPILDQILRVFPATLELCFFSMLIALAIGLPLGILVGIRQGKMVDNVISFIAMLGYAAPIFWLALISILFFSLNLNLTPTSGRYNLLYQIDYKTGFALIDTLISKHPNRLDILADLFNHLLLPAIVMAIAPATEIIRLMRAHVSEVMKKHYIRAAKIRGLNKYQIIWRHVLPNAIPPMLPKIGIQLTGILTYAIVIESIFNWPGIGLWLIEALFNHDYAAIQAGVFVVAGFVLCINIFSDLIGAILNPVKRKQWNVVK